MYETTDTELGRIDEAVMVIKMIRKRRMDLVKGLEKRKDLSETQKIFIGQEYDLWRGVDNLSKLAGRRIDAELGIIPPHSIEIEKTVLGAVILESPAFDKVKAFLKPEHFYLDAHRTIYEACLALYPDPVDMRTVVTQLRRMSSIEIVGGPAAIAELTAGVSSAANAESHARILVEYAIKREIIRTFSQVLLFAYDEDRDFAVLLDHAKTELNRIDAWTKI